MTHTRTHVYTVLANPYLRCDQCKTWITGYHNDEKCGCRNGEWQNRPCDHEAGAVDVCPSWGPVDGCQCLRIFGEVGHPVPPADVIGERKA